MTEDGSVYEDAGKKMLLFGHFNRETKVFTLNKDHHYFNGLKDHCKECGERDFHKAGCKLRKVKSVMEANRVGDSDTSLVQVSAMKPLLAPRNSYMCGHGMRLDSPEYNMHRPPPEELDFLAEASDLLQQFSTGKIVTPDGGVFTLDAVGVGPRPSPRSAEEYAAYCKNRNDLLVKTATWYFSLPNQRARVKRLYKFIMEKELNRAIHCLTEEEGWQMDSRIHLSLYLGAQEVGGGKAGAAATKAAVRLIATDDSMLCFLDSLNVCPCLRAMAADVRNRAKQQGNAVDETNRTIATAKTVTARVCNACGTRAGLAGSTDLMRCGRCLSVYYCNAECQRSDWKTHKLNCRKD